MWGCRESRGGVCVGGLEEMHIGHSNILARALIERRSRKSHIREPTTLDQNLIPG